MPGVVRDRDVLEAALGLALEDSQFFLVYKPVFDLARGRMSHAEALLRWRHPVQGVIAPNLFLPALEESGLIVPLGRQILSSACERAAAWRGGGRDLDVSVNLSAAELASPGIVAAVADALRWSGLEAPALMLELSEGTLAADEQLSRERLEALRELGVRVALDNFRPGRSRIAGLLRFPIDAVKLDRSVCLGAGADSEEVIALITRQGRMLGLDVLGYTASRRRGCERAPARAPAAALAHVA
jgi:diguanylate cyclase